MPKAVKAIGLMSGTSLDGIDAALLVTDGETVVRRGAALTVPYDVQTRIMLHAALEEARNVAEGAPVPYAIRDAERHITLAHAEAVRELIRKSGETDVELIGFHGQTILHRPARRWTWQIGDGALLASLTGIDVVNDFRSADVKAGGQGAPLVPLYHAALVKTLAQPKPPLVVANIGGVANITYVGADIVGERVLAFDTGPGNAPIDDWVRTHTGEMLDKDGALARSGHIDVSALAAMLDNPFFAAPPPKSLDRMDFGTKAVAHLSPADGAATLTAFTAVALTRARDHFPEPANAWIICGGGRHNGALMAQLRSRLNVPVMTAEDAGWAGDFIEAEAFAFLAVRSANGLSLSLPSTTGVAMPMTGGRFYRAVPRSRPFNAPDWGRSSGG